MSPSDEGLPAGRPEKFGAADRVRRRSEYRRIQSRGVKVHSRRLLWMVHASLGADSLASGSPVDHSLVDRATNRLGLVVTKKLGSAVQRNRIKRVLREVFRRNRALFPLGVDLVVVAKNGLDVANFGYEDVVNEVRTAQASLQRAARRARAEVPAHTGSVVGGGA